MLTARLPLLLSPALLLVGCGGDTQEQGGGRDSSSLPLGFELAAAATGETAATVTVAAPMIDLTPEQLAERIKAGKVRVIDVRTDDEVAEGVIPGAEHIPLDHFEPASLDLSDGREIVLYCRSGRRSAIAGAMLAEVTGQPVQHLAGGITAWEAAGQPVEKH
ncbi:rhodanese-like domain-containing protein [Erythrobacter tepidarius]|uniref:rhodanese-like domain-containing protein n=1 Tax=Erythrobacter tepidarius TaxID=60454 RepID=UPI000A38355E|nr:rhodanese-like domain-containing protein [Erythrobacter tepidarius]